MVLMHRGIVVDSPRSDLQVVGGSTAAHALGLVIKQLGALGVPYLPNILEMCRS